MIKSHGKDGTVSRRDFIRLAIFSNCEYLEIFIDGHPKEALTPDRKIFANLAFSPFFANLNVDGSKRPELCINGYINGRLVLSRLFSSDEAKDCFLFCGDRPPGNCQLARNQEHHQNRSNAALLRPAWAVTQ